MFFEIMFTESSYINLTDFLSTEFAESMDELRREVSTLREFVVQQSKDMAKLKRLGKGLDVSPGPADTSRLLSIEAELVEQKKSTARITKLCLAAINALERLENKPLVLGSDIASSDESFINRKIQNCKIFKPGNFLLIFSCDGKWRIFNLKLI